jgi:DNA-binding NarL/FixJ family response regulator
VRHKLPQKPAIRIAMVEDDQLRLVGLRSLLSPVDDFELIAMSAAEIVSDGSVSVALIGNHTGVKFFDVMASLTMLRPDLRIIVTGFSSDEEAIFKVIAAGAKGYVQEAASPSELARAVYAVHGGAIWAPRRVLAMFIERSGALTNSQNLQASVLTSREKEVLRMLVEGHSNKEIGVPLGIEERTVKAHVAKMMRKVGVRNRIALTVHAISHSLISAQAS